MIREWRLRHFKSVSDYQKFEFRPLTVFTGANSSGKSSVLQSVLLISQTLSSKVVPRQLVLNGEHLKLGVFDDVVSECAENECIDVGFALDYEPGNIMAMASNRVYGRRYYMGYYANTYNRGCFDVDLRFGPVATDEEENTPKMRSLQAQLTEARFSARLEPRHSNKEFLKQVSLSVQRRSKDEVEAIQQSYGVSGVGSREYIDGRVLAYRATVDPRGTALYRKHLPRGVSGSADVVAVALDHFLPSWLIVAVSSALRQVSRDLEKLSTARHVQELFEKWRMSTDGVRKAIVSAIDKIAGENNVPVVDLLNSLVASEKMLQSRVVKNLSVEISREVMGQLEKSDRIAKDLEITELPEGVSFLCAAVSDTFASLRTCLQIA